MRVSGNSGDLYFNEMRVEQQVTILGFERL